MSSTPFRASSFRAPSSGASSSGASLRIGDAEREAAVAALNSHFAEGRLTSLEHDERTTIALGARVRADLDALFADLPRQGDDHSSPGPLRSAGNNWRNGRAAWIGVPAVFTAVFAAVMFVVFLHVVPLFALVLVFVMSRIALGWGRRTGRRSQELGCRSVGYRARGF